MPRRKFNPIDIYRFNKNTKEEQEFYAKVKSSIRECWQPGQQIAWFDFWSWLRGFLEQEVRAGFVLDIILFLSQENVIKSIGVDVYELIQPESP